MDFKTTNPATGHSEDVCHAMTAPALSITLSGAQAAGVEWRARDIAARCDLVAGAARVLRDNLEHYARLMTLEMGKPIREAGAEV